MSKMNKKLSLTLKSLALLIAAVLISSGVTFITSSAVYAASISTTFTIDSGAYPGAPSYTVYGVSGTYYAKDQNGYNEFSGTDAATVIQSAVSASTNGGTIFLKPGTYGITKTINVSGSITLEGETFTEIASPKATHLTMGANAYMFETQGYGITFRNLLLDGARGTYLDSGLIYGGATDSFYVTIENCLILAYGTKHGISTLLGSDNEAWTIRNCIINTYDKSLSNYGIWFNDGGGHRIYNNEIASSTRGIRLYQCDNVQIGGVMNYFYDCGRAIEYEDVDRLTINANSFSGNTLDVVPMGTNSNVKIWSNIGYVTENSGSATNVTSTTFSFNHGLSGTPTSVLCSFNTTAVSGWAWTANVTAIDITVSGTGLPASITAYWKAEYQP